MRLRVVLCIAVLALCAVASCRADDDPHVAAQNTMADIQRRIEQVRAEQQRVREEVERMIAERRREHEERLAEMRAMTQNAEASAAEATARASGIHRQRSSNTFSSSGDNPDVAVFGDSDSVHIDGLDESQIYRGSSRPGRPAMPTDSRRSRRSRSLLDTDGRGPGAPSMPDDFGRWRGAGAADEMEQRMRERHEAVRREMAERQLRAFGSHQPPAPPAPAAEEQASSEQEQPQAV